MVQMDGGAQRPRRAWMATVAGILAVVILLAWGVWNVRQSDRQAQGLLFNTIRQGEVVSRLRIDLLKAVEAEKSAVLAETDQLSEEQAQLARQASEAVETRLKELRALLSASPSPRESELLNEFSRAWAEFRKVDQEILNLAVLNTNLKAAGLSQGPVRQTLDELQKALDGLREQRAATPAGRKVDDLATRAVIAGLKLALLQAPHINDPSDEGMDRLEAQMAEQEQDLRQSLAGLEALLGEDGRPALDQARAAAQRLVDLNNQVVRLSRQNSNIKSLTLSLGHKRRVAAQCQDILAALQETIQDRVFKATR